MSHFMEKKLYFQPSAIAFSNVCFGCIDSVKKKKLQPYFINKQRRKIFIFFLPFITTLLKVRSNKHPFSTVFISLKHLFERRQRVFSLGEPNFSITKRI